jgi:two-component system chemotaxis response regulator CheY
MFKILVVDDSVILRKSLINVLKGLGHEVVAEAGSGYEAIESYKSNQPDIVTMDITMPGVQGVHNGVEALKEIKKIDPEAKVVMVTSHGEEELVMDAISAGAKGYVLKPVTKEKMEAIFKKFN